MNKYSILKRTIVAFSFLTVITALSSLGSGCSAGGDSPSHVNWYEGSWTGEVKESWIGGVKDPNQKSVVVNLSLKGTKGKSTFIYKDPRACTLNVEFSKDTGDNGQEYSTTMSTGGFCDKMYPGTLLLKKQGDKSLSFDLISDDKSKQKISEKGTLSRPDSRKP